MDSMLDAAIWFWIPMLLIPLGLWFSISGKAKVLGNVVSFLGLALVMASSWTVPNSDSSAAGHLLLWITAPTILLCYGMHGAIFGGNVPVGRLDPSARYSGYGAVFLSLLILCLMHWSSLTPLWRNEEINPYWIVFWPTFLLFSTSLLSLAALALVSYGEDRGPEAVKLAAFSVLMAGIAIAGITFDGNKIAAEQFQDYLWLAAADIFGSLIGATIALGVFAAVIWGHEKSLPVPSNTEPPTNDEIKHVVNLAKKHIVGEEE